MFKKKKEEKEKGKAEDEENDFPIYFMGCGGKQWPERCFSLN